MKERDISLRDLTVEILLQWRMLVIAMLAGALLAGGFSYVRSFREAKAVRMQMTTEQPEDGKELAALQESLTQEQLQKLKDVMAYEKLYEEKKAYQQDSVLLQMNPNQVYQMEMLFYVNADKKQTSRAVETAYEDIAQGGGIYAYAALQTDQVQADIAGCITLYSGDSERAEGAEGAGTFKVRVVHSEKEACQKISDAVQQYLKQQQKELEKSIGGHQLVLLQESFLRTADSGILERQKNSLTDLMAMSDTIAQRKAAFTEEEKQYYKAVADIPTKEGALDDQEKTQTEVLGSDPAAPGISFRLVAFGMVSMVLVCVFILFFKYVTSGTICYADRLQELFGISQLGLIIGQEGASRVFGFVDRWILSLRTYGRRSFSGEEALRLSTAAVKLAAKKEQADAISLIGCNLTKEIMKICEAIKQELEKDGMRVVIQNNVLYDAQAMKELQEVKSAVLVEQVKATFYSEITQELELLRRQEIVVLGGILVEVQ